PVISPPWLLASASTFQIPAFSTLMEKGGVVMWPLLFCSFLGLAVVLERLGAFLVFAVAERRARHKLDPIYAALGRGDVDTAIALGQEAGPVGRFLALGLKHRECGLTQGLEDAGQQVLERLRSGLAILDTLVTLSPMLGILGTVTGIIASFELLGASTVGSDPTAVSAGIAEALVTTAAGLVISIMALIPFNLFRSQIARWARKLERAGRQCERACAKGCGDAP
ncbi:MAG: MotA/TolQ/ExbB proton channel family protein, partial [Kiritimatiellia bacterium]